MAIVESAGPRHACSRTPTLFLTSGLTSFVAGFNCSIMTTSRLLLLAPNLAYFHRLG
jgi:hypothetical protein